MVILKSALFQIFSDYFIIHNSKLMTMFSIPMFFLLTVMLSPTVIAVPTFLENDSTSFSNDVAALSSFSAFLINVLFVSRIVPIVSRMLEVTLTIYKLI